MINLPFSNFFFFDDEGKFSRFIIFQRGTDSDGERYLLFGRKSGTAEKFIDQPGTKPRKSGNIYHCFRFKMDKMC